MRHMSQKKIFKKSQNFQLFFFKKRGLKGSKNENFQKKISDLKCASNNTYETCATCPQKGFSKKVKIMFFFKKGGLRGSKNAFFEKIFPKNYFFEKIFPKSKRAIKFGY